MLEATVTAAPAGKTEYVRQSGPAFLSYRQLVSLSEHDEIPPTLNSGVKFLADNPERGLFQSLQKFRFDDGTAFDFRGVKDCTDPPTPERLPIPNQRAGKGFTTTFQFARTLGPKGKFRLDWIFVKAYDKDPLDPAGPYRFAPHFARTLSAVNYAFAERISDHNPTVVDLPFEEKASQ